ncbi:dynamin family protein [Helicobacter marmotae]|uniref:GTP-binding protein n=1 Tax=Helicobacter marmotae TaxID=152490 RepID=A0A3D8I2S7_9HELI|nr:dynamin family protein [Helicobacter marmotae]RDU59442.1 GTP-binding protein [Helicobacter marmotae]
MGISDSVQTPLLETFIKEYEQAKKQLLQESNPTYALIDEVKESLSAVAELDSYTLDTLNGLIAHEQEPMKVAIIGQFSSGKSTFLNALLGQNILPSGITPITAKVCHITYGNEYALEITYKNGSSATKALNYMHEVSAAENAKIAFYKLYAPLALLKSINFLDTPGFNSLNQSDTDTTNAVLESVDGIIWLTLIDNVGKQSEKDIIHSHIKHYASKSLCVLNQKDRLKNQAEIDTSLAYAKRAFAGLFEDVIAISARNALLAYSTPEAQEAQNLREDSHIQDVIDFLQTHIAPCAHKAKLHSIYKQLCTLTLTYARLSLHASLRFDKLISSLKDLPTHFSDNYPQSAFYKSFPTLFHTFESLLETLSRHIYNALEKTPKTFMRTEKVFGISRQKPYTKEITTLPRERLAINLCNTDSEFRRDFIKLGFDISAKAEEFDSLILAHLGYLKDIIIHWYEMLIPPLQNPLLHKTLENITDAYANLTLQTSQNLKNQLMLYSKILSLNYPLALHLCLNTISLKIHEALQKHTQSPDTLPLFNPSLENIRDELYMGFSFNFLQESLLTQPIHKKILWQFEHEEKLLSQKQIEIILPYQERYSKHYKQLKSLFHKLKAKLKENR